MITDRIEWAAGFLDADAHIGTIRHTSREKVACIRIAINHTDRRPLAVLQEQLRGGKIHELRSSYDAHRRRWRWEVLGDGAAFALRLVTGSLVSKAHQAELALAIHESSDQRAKWLMSEELMAEHHR